MRQPSAAESRRVDSPSSRQIQTRTVDFAAGDFARLAGRQRLPWCLVSLRICCTRECDKSRDLRCEGQVFQLLEQLQVSGKKVTLLYRRRCCEWSEDGHWYRGRCHRQFVVGIKYGTFHPGCRQCSRSSTAGQPGANNQRMVGPVELKIWFFKADSTQRISVALYSFRSRSAALCPEILRQCCHLSV